MFLFSNICKFLIMLSFVRSLLFGPLLGECFYIVLATIDYSHFLFYFLDFKKTLTSDHRVAQKDAREALDFFYQGGPGTDLGATRNLK